MRHLRPPLTTFQHKVYEVVKLIPCGKVTTYKAIAMCINCLSSQAVGGALKCNPFAPKLPCHRVIASNLTLGGYKGSKNEGCLAEKRGLLQAEGVQFDRQGRVKQAFVIKLIPITIGITLPVVE